MSWLGEKTTVKFGDWVSKSSNTVYQAETDGFVIASHSPNLITFGGFTDIANPPLTERQRDNGHDGGGFAMPVRKDDFWEVVIAGGLNTLFWIPLEL